MKKLLRIIRNIFLGILLFVLLYLAAAWLLPKIVIDKEAGTGRDIPMYVVSNGVHTDLVVPVRTDQIDWSKEIKYTDTKAADSTYTYIGMGWGDQEFFLDMPTWNNLTFGKGFRAAFGINKTAIHATFYKPEDLMPRAQCKKMWLSNEQYSRLIKYINNTLKHDKNSHLINIKTDAVYGVSDAFYEAQGRYNMFHSCNTWTNNALKISGQKACFWTATDKGILNLYE